RPYHPAGVDFDHPRIYDSDSILDLDYEPKHVIIYGAGVIGCEYASIFRGLNVKVDLINTRDRLLAFLDQ
ncbi:NAD(P)(+) transhydrogenase, partial [Pectobacterium versatile]|nr:NAD(P)(+) transhydrogenase [Pectobacterium versatile]